MEQPVEYTSLKPCQAIIYKGSESSWKMWYLSGKAACPHYAAVLKK